MGKNISTITNIILSVSWLEVLSHNVRLEIGLTLDGMTKGNSVMPAVKITPNCINDAIKNPHPGRPR